MIEIISRREFFKVAGTAATAVAFTPTALITEAQAKEKKNLFDMLKGYTFKDENGNVVNIKALKESLKDQYVTLSFGFTGCSIMCPLEIEPNLAVIGNKNADRVTSIAINVTPENELDASGFKEIMKQRGDIKHSIITLFPRSNKEAVDIQIKAFEQLANMDDPNQHAARIFLFAPGGDLIKNDIATRPENTFQAWGKEISEAARAR